MNIEVVEPALFAGAAADEIISIINEAVAERGRAVVFLSGGSTPGAVYRLMGLPPRSSEIPFAKTHFFLGDERCVSIDSAQSNYHMVIETLFQGEPAKAKQLYSIDPNLTPGDAAIDYERSYLASRVNGNLPIPDLVLLGLGEDGHTASLFPGSPLLKEETKLFAHAMLPAGSKAPIANRISLTPRLLRQARKIVVLVTGEAKADVLHQVLHGKDSVADVPAKIALLPQTFWLIDSGAAKKLPL